MASRIAATFAAARPRALLVPYLTVGWPTPAASGGLLAALERGGADIIEIGVPFSDPSADGPVIQRANEEALSQGASLTSALTAAAAYRDAGGTLPVVLMGYANPFLRYGPARLAAACAASGVDGVLAVDWPPGVADGLGGPLATAGIDRIVLLAPTTTQDRATQLGAAGSGYAYYVSIQGVTGTRRLDAAAVAAAGARLRVAVGLPLAVGFGVRTPEDCAQLGTAFDAVIVGSRLLEEIRDAGAQAPAAATRLLAAMREALT